MLLHLVEKLCVRNGWYWGENFLIVRILLVGVNINTFIEDCWNLVGIAFVDGWGFVGVAFVTSIAAIWYHFTCQFPGQSDVLTCLSPFACFNVFFLSIALFSETSASSLELCFILFVFNSVLVFHI
jgi:hypothetical protein